MREVGKERGATTNEILINMAAIDNRTRLVRIVVSAV